VAGHLRTGAIPAQAGIGARLGERQIALFRFGEQVYALDNLEPGSDANVLSRGMLGDAGGEPMVISPLYKQRIRLRDGRPCDGGEPMVRAWPVKIENGTVWVGTSAAGACGGLLMDHLSLLRRGLRRAGEQGGKWPGQRARR
jgi:NAD(P)H-dependent nitrite reductase small subunit